MGVKEIDELLMTCWSPSHHNPVVIEIISSCSLIQVVNYRHFKSTRIFNI